MLEKDGVGVGVDLQRSFSVGHSDIEVCVLTTVPEAVSSYVEVSLTGDV